MFKYGTFNPLFFKFKFPKISGDLRLPDTLAFPETSPLISVITLPPNGLIAFKLKSSNSMFNCI